MRKLEETRPTQRTRSRRRSGCNCARRLARNHHQLRRADSRRSSSSSVRRVVKRGAATAATAVAIRKRASFVAAGAIDDCRRRRRRRCRHRRCRCSSCGRECALARTRRASAASKTPRASRTNGGECEQAARRRTSERMRAHTNAHLRVTQQGAAVKRAPSEGQIGRGARARAFRRSIRLIVRIE